ncbi:DNA-binding response regulator [Flagellimonas lutimaris]|uniref:DNA-binding response regulator n=1 Tax=Flagellimonas lutimaris TaxID=475082 RepID=A0A3A1NCN2_9FLAO|nr:LytTR family DNA-binding domain-containing protein [Allomuricauda lutimaris]RIV35994.1 DNA-binding response regulator [Allomuricauda lutimaris]
MTKCLIIEDEKEAQDMLLGYIQKTPFLECIGVFESGLDVTRDLMLKAHIMFLDIQLPGLNGLSYLRTLNTPPKVIITTAFQNYAVEAFDYQASDYLLKPFSYERFLKAVDRTMSIKKVIDVAPVRSLFIYADKVYHNLNIDDILFVKAEVDYVKIITAKKNYLVLDSLSNWQAKLEPFNFNRVHRSFLVPISKIERIEGNRIVIHDFIIPIGNKYKDDLISRIIDKGNR